MEAVNPIIHRFVIQPAYSPIEIKKKDTHKRELYQQMREHKHCVQAFQQMDTVSRIVEEHGEVFKPAPRAQSTQNNRLGLGSSFSPNSRGG